MTPAHAATASAEALYGGRPTAVVAEDEPLLRDQLVDMLALVWPELRVVAAAEDGLQAVRALERHAPDVVFLDILMPGLTGLDVARQASGRSHVVFVTAFDQYAVAAFEEGAADYVMKPLSVERLTTACSRVRQRLGAAATPANLERLLETLAAARERAYLRWINVSQGADVRLLTVDEICYFRSDTKYTRAATPELEALIRKSLKELLDELDPTVFWQIHRSTIVNVNAIRSLSRDFRGRLVVKLKSRPETLPVSEAFEHLFRQM